MTKKLIKKSFTLLEIIITITILSFCFSFFGIKINALLYSHRYSNNLKKIESYIAFCKKVSETNQADISLKLFQKNKRIFLEIGTDEKVGIFENSKKISDIFDDITFTFNEKNIDNIEIIFSSNGEYYPKGKFVFFDKKAKWKDEIKIEKI